MRKLSREKKQADRPLPSVQFKVGLCFDSNKGYQVSPERQAIRNIFNRGIPPALGFLNTGSIPAPNLLSLLLAPVIKKSVGRHSGAY